MTPLRPTGHVATLKIFYEVKIGIFILLKTEFCNFADWVIKSMAYIKFHKKNLKLNRTYNKSYGSVSVKWIMLSSCKA